MTTTEPEPESNGALVVQQDRPTETGVSLPALATMSDGAFDQLIVNARRGIERLARLQIEVMVEGVHYGVIPGTGERKTLLQPGADFLVKAQNCVAHYPEDRLRRTVLPTPEGVAPLVCWDVVCEARDRVSGDVMAVGSGSCNTHEPKYRYRWAQGVCPICGNAEVFLPSRDGTGWFCWARRGGCGAQIPNGDPRLATLHLGKVENLDAWGLDNTVKKMAAKRAKVACANELSLASGTFAQDLEDLAANNLLPDTERASAEPAPSRPATPRRGRGTRGRAALGPRQEPMPPPTAPPPTEPPAEGEVAISDEQRRLLFVRAKERVAALGLEPAPDVHHNLLRHYLATIGISTTLAVPAASFTSVLEGLATYTPEGL